MRKLFIIIFFLSFLSCRKDPSSHNEKLFDPQKLSLLSLEEVNHFWQDDSLKYYSNYFNNCLGYIGGIGLCGDKKDIAIAVFESETKAIECMEGRINTVAIVIKEGVPNEIIKEKWWYTDGMASTVFVNKWNTIVEVHYFETNYEEEKLLLLETAAEIVRRIDSLSK